MADKKISELTAGTPIETDILPYVDLTTGETKKALKSELQGEPGDSATVDAGTTTTGAPGTDATVVNSGTTSAAVFDFTIPRGDVGDDGDAATIAVGTTTTLAPGEDATVTNSGTTSAAVFDFGIPEGEAGADGVVQSIVGGTNITVDSADTANPIINADADDNKADKLTISKVTSDVNPAVANTHYLVDASSGNVTISLPDVTASDDSIYQVTLSVDTNKCTITTVGGTQIIGPGSETSVINHTVGGSLFFAANGVDGYDITGDSRTYYRNIELTGAGTTDLSTIGYESGSIYHATGMVSGETRTIIIPDDPSDFDGFWFKTILDGEGTVIIRTLSSNEINGNTEIDIVNDGGGVEISSFGTYYGIVQDSRPKVQNVALTFYSLGEASTVVDPDVGYAFYNQSCNSIDDTRFDQVTATTRTIAGITGTDFYGGGLVGDEGVIGGLLPEGPVTSTGNFRKTAGSGDFNYYVEYYKYESGGTETLLATSTNSQTISSATAAGYTVIATLPETTFTSTDRLLRKIYLNKVGGGSDPTAEFSAEGAIPSFSQVSIGASSITHNSLGGLQLADNGVTYGHIDDQAQTIYGAKTFDTDINSGITGLSGTKTEFNTALSDDNFAYLGEANEFTSTGVNVFSGKVRSTGFRFDTTEYIGTNVNNNFKVIGEDSHQNTAQDFYINFDDINDGVGDFIITKGARDGAGTELARVLNNGNVGVGVVAPGKKLEVAGDAGYNATTDMGSADTDFTSKKYVDDNFAYTGQANTFTEDQEITGTLKTTRAINYDNTDDFDLLGTTEFSGNISIASVPANAPTAGDAFVGITGAISSARSVQNLISTTGDQQSYFRSANNSIWSDWKRVIYEDMGTNDITLNPDGVTGVKIKSDGKVGIGTTVPGAELDVDGDIKGDTEINTQTGTTYTLAIGDRSSIIEMNNASANTVTIPTNASVGFPVGTTLSIIQYGAGLTTATGDTGVTVNGVSGGSKATSAQYEGLALYKRGTNEWVIVNK